MIQKMWVLCGAVVAFGVLSSGCPSGGVGDPCTPEDEYNKTFPGYEVSEVNTESKSFQCETRLCLVNQFQGRVSCPYGQTEAAWKWKAGESSEAPKDFHSTSGLPSKAWCHVPGTSDDGHLIKSEVLPQLASRTASQAVYCSCRCDGPDKSARYCPCPSGYECAPLVRKNDALGKAELAGSYCIKNGTGYEGVGAAPCTPGNLGADPPGDCGKWTGD